MAFRLVTCYLVTLGLLTCELTSAAPGKYGKQFKPVQPMSCVETDIRSNPAENLEDCTSQCGRSSSCGSFEYYDPNTQAQPSGKYSPKTCNLNSFIESPSANCSAPELDLYVRLDCDWETVPGTSPNSNTTTVLDCGAETLIDLSAGRQAGFLPLDAAKQGLGRCRDADGNDLADETFAIILGIELDVCMERCYLNDFANTEIVAPAVCTGIEFVLEDQRCELHTGGIATVEQRDGTQCWLLNRDSTSNDCRRLARLETTCGLYASSDLTSCACSKATPASEACTTTTAIQSFQSKISTVEIFRCDETVPVIPGETEIPIETNSPTDEPVSTDRGGSTEYLLAGGLGGAAIVALGTAIVVIRHRNRMSHKRHPRNPKLAVDTKKDRFASPPPPDVYMPQKTGMKWYQKKTSAENLTTFTSRGNTQQPIAQRKKAKKRSGFKAMLPSMRFSKPLMARFTQRALPSTWVATLDPVTLTAEYRNIETGQVSANAPVSSDQKTESVLFEEGLREHYKQKKAQGVNNYAGKVKPEISTPLPIAEQVRKASKVKGGGNNAGYRVGGGSNVDRRIGGGSNADTTNMKFKAKQPAKKVHDSVSPDL